MLGVSTKQASMQRWKSFLHHWQSYNERNTQTQPLCVPMNKVFANCSKEDKISPLTTADIAQALRTNATLKHLFKCNAVFDIGLEIKLIVNTFCVWKYGWLLIPKPLQLHAVTWYHHYLQHPGSWTYTSWRNNEGRNVLEKYAYHHLVNNEVLQDLLN